ncbi:unnamed protein product [Onchocerca flexuosa]|uniref:Apple domain-containing protein n=1 Tax=Onchocerca flexuosa TaxID=387005 RepID=A0A183HYH0_9BILA|nr:unnamed protein product [Onchocerca flexuosa]
MKVSTPETFSSPENEESDFQLPRFNPQFIGMACIVVFEVNPEANLADFRAQDSVKVKRADHCAYLCFRDACAAAVFTPPTAPGSKGTCERRFDMGEKCNATLRRDYYYKTNKPVYLQCFRCLPKKPETKPPFEGTTLQPEISLFTSKAIFATETDESAELEETTVVPSMELTTTEMDSEEIEKSMGITAFDANNGNIGTSIDAIESKDEVARETTQKLGTSLAMSSTPDTETKASATAILTDTTNTEITTRGTTISSTINDKMFENISSSDETESGASDSPTTAVNAQSIREQKSSESRTQTLEPEYQTTVENQESTPATAEELGVLQMSTIEAEVGHDTLSFGSQTKMQFKGAESAGTDNSPHETGKPTTAPLTVEMETTDSEIPTEVAHADRSTKAASSNSGREDAFSKGKKNGSLSSDVDEALQMKHYLQGVLIFHFTATIDPFAMMDIVFGKQCPSEVRILVTFSQLVIGCIVTFQAEPFSKRRAESSTGFQVTITAQTAEVCAGRCYQDGCTGAKYDPSNKECVLTYGGKHFCNNGPEHFFYKANETVWIHCTICKMHKPGDEGINIMIQPSKTKAMEKTALKQTEVSSTVTLPFTETVGTKVQKVESTKLNEILQTKSDVTSEKSTFNISKIEKSTENAKDRLINETSTSLVEETSTEIAKVSTIAKEITAENTMEKKEKISKEESNIDDIPTSTVVGKIEESERKEEITAAPFQTTFPGHNCTILFQVKPIDVHSKEFTSKFISTNATHTVKQCAKRCFMDGCVGAKFDPVKQECLLTFGDHHQCDENEQVHQSVETTEALWIHCISCKKEFTESTLGLLTQDTTTLSALEPVEVEEKFLATTDQTMEVEFSTKSKESKVTVEEFGITPTTVVEKEQETLRSSTLQSTMESSAGISESTTASHVIEGEQKDQKEAIVAFQKEGEPTTISAEVTIIPISDNEITLQSKVGTFEGQKFSEVTENDLVEAVADIIANIPSNVSETKPDIGIRNIEQTRSMLEESFTETVENLLSSVAPEIAVTESNIRETSEADVISLVAEESASTDSNIGVIQLKQPSTKKMLSNIAEQTSTSINDQGNIEITSRILNKTSEEGGNPAEAESVSDSVTEQSFVQENVDDIMEKVVQPISEEDILVTNIKEKVTDKTVDEAIQVVTEASNVVDILTKQGDMTTEPPVQAVSDLISVLSQNSKIEEIIRKKENDAFVVNDLLITKNADDQKTNDIVISDTQRDSVENSLLKSAKINPFKGKIVECPGRIEFEILEVGDLSQLTVTNEILVESPAACAMKCYETANCTLAAYKPNQNDESTAVCLLTSDSAVCSSQKESVPQHKADVSPFIISCLKCTKCNYTISAVTELTKIHQPQIVEPALSIGQCAEICSKHNCTISQYDHKSNLCSLTLVESQAECPLETPILVNGDEAVSLECVRCFA